MNREIKFRHWDKKKNRWLNDFDEVYLNTDGYASIYNTNGYTAFLQGVDVEVMQYTGLKDCNGVEIYEGDVVRYVALFYDFEKPDGEEKYLKELISHIVYRGHGFWVFDENYGWEGERLWDWTKLEVIGNIYTHPNYRKSETNKDTINP